MPASSVNSNIVNLKVYGGMFDVNMKVSGMLAISVTMKLQQHVIWKSMFCQYMMASSLSAISVTIKCHNSNSSQLTSRKNICKFPILYIYIETLSVECENLNIHIAYPYPTIVMIHTCTWQKMTHHIWLCDFFLWLDHLLPNEHQLHWSGSLKFDCSKDRPHPLLILAVDMSGDPISIPGSIDLEVWSLTAARPGHILSSTSPWTISHPREVTFSDKTPAPRQRRRSSITESHYTPVGVGAYCC